MKKKTLFNYIKFKLQTDRNWQTNALLKIFEFQTAQEQRVEETMIHNDVGFTGCDGHILASFAKQWQKRNWLSDKQFFILSKKITKYWHQIYNISASNPAKLQILHDQTLAWVQSEIAARQAIQQELPLTYKSGEE